MPGDGVGHVGLFPVVQRVIAAHGALDLGEFAHHRGGEIGLAQPRRALGQGGVGVGVAGQPARQPGEALHLLRHGAEPGVEDAPREVGHAAFQCSFSILVPKELGVRQARPQHPFVAGDDGLAFVPGFGVGDEYEAGREVAVLIEQGEILLVMAHGGGQHLRRQVHEGGVDAPHQHHRPFHQPGVLVEQAGVGLEGQFGRPGQLFRLGQNRRPPLGRIEDHLGFRELRLVIGEVVDLEGRGREETMAQSHITRGLVAETDTHDLTTEHA